MISIDRRQGKLSEQIYGQFRELILSGALKWKDQLPASRMLAEDHGVSRNTVLQAYERLTAEGYTQTTPGAGLFVANIVPAHIVPANKATRSARKPSGIRTSALADRVNQIPDAYLQRTVKAGAPIEFLYGEPSYEDFPHQTWARILGKVARLGHKKHLSYPDYQGLPVLRQAIAAYLTRARGIQCNAENVLIVHGTQEAIDLCCRLIVNEGDPVVCEDPGYRGFLKAAMATGADVSYVSVDDAGLRTTDLPETGRLVFVTPSHQFPTGSVLPISRRLALLDWAERHEAIIFEDDYDGEFRYGGSPVASLKSLDKNNSVIYVGTVSKTFFPALRLGWMIVPESLRKPLVKLRAISDTTPPAMEQLALAEFIDSGHFERHVFRTRKRYAEKRRLLLSTLTEQLGDKIFIRGSDAGIHVLIDIPGLKSKETETLQAGCLARGVAVNSAHAYYKSKAPSHVVLIIGYNAVPVEDVKKGALMLAKEINAMLVKNRSQQG